MADEIDWQGLKNEFVKDAKLPSLSDFCVTKNLAYGSVKNRSSREKWMTERDQYWSKVTAKSEPILGNTEAAVMARDTASRLTEIRAMADHAYRAIVPANGEALRYEKPSDAVQAYERLVKLERLLTDQSTEIISVRDARQMVDDILTAAEEVFGNDARLSSFAQRLAGLRPIQSEAQGTMGASLN